MTEHEYIKSQTLINQKFSQTIKSRQVPYFKYPNLGPYKLPFDKEIIRGTSTITHTKFTNITSFLLYKCTKIFHPLHTDFIPT